MNKRPIHPPPKDKLNETQSQYQPRPQPQFQYNNNSNYNQKTEEESHDAQETKYFGSSLTNQLSQHPYGSIHTTSQAHKIKPKDYKISPEKIPRPNHFTEIYSNSEDQSPIYSTSIDSLPPFASSYYSVRETQNSSCRFIRSTLTKIPTTQAILSQSNLIFSLYLQPFTELPDHELPIPKVDINDRIFRCKTCQSYINLHYKIDYGKKSNHKVAICNLCNAETEVDIPGQQGVKDEYLASDISNVPELTIPTIDYSVPSYHTNGINEGDIEIFTPHYIFMIDYSIGSHAIGLPGYILNSIQNNLTLFHNAKETYITICTYDNKSINFFYSDDTNHNEIKCCIMTDINNPFCPISPKKLFTNITIHKSTIEKMIEKIIIHIEAYHSSIGNCKSYSDNTAATGAAIASGIDSLITHGGGRVMIFTASSCTVGFGSCKVKDDNAYYNTERESVLYQPQHKDFETIIEKATLKGITVDQFIIDSTQYDLATYSVISNLTGGHVKYYPIGKETNELNWTYEKLYYDVTRIITRPNYYNVKFMIRYTEGIDCFEILGAFNKKLGEAFHISSCDPDYSFAYNFRLIKDLQPNQRISFQIACLYNDNFNHKYLRVFNYSIIATPEVNRIYLLSDVDALAKITLMKEVSLAIQLNPEAARQNLYSRLLNSFSFYRKEGSSDNDATQLILPSSMKYLPLYFNSFLKKNLLGNTKAYSSSNALMFLMNNILRNPLYVTMKFLYPKLYRIDDILYDQSYKFKDKKQVIEGIGLVNERYNKIQLPFKMRLSMDEIDFDSAYIIDDGEYVNLFVFDRIEGEFYKELFGVDRWEECVKKGICGIDFDGDDDSDFKRRIGNIIGEMRRENGGFCQGVRVYYLSERNYYSNDLTRLLIEDKFYYETNYVDFLCKLHEDIQRSMI